MNNGENPVMVVVEAYYAQENERRSKWIAETMKSITPPLLHKHLVEGKPGIEDMIKAWFKEEGYKMEISPDNLLIQIWKGNEQIAQYQTILPQFVQFVDGNAVDPTRLVHN